MVYVATQSVASQLLAPAAYINFTVQLGLHGILSPQVSGNGVKVGLPLAHQLLLVVRSLQILGKLPSVQSGSCCSHELSLCVVTHLLLWKYLQMISLSCLRCLKANLSPEV